MKSVLVTAFEPYDRWTTNASWLCLVELTRELPSQPNLVTRRYPVDFAAARQRLSADLESGFDYVIHLGQSPGDAAVRLEAIGLNVGAEAGDLAAGHFPLEPDGPVAYRSSLPLALWQAKLRQAGIPARLSFHAGTYLCNALLYWTHYLSERMGRRTEAALVHVPLELSQVAAGEPLPALPAAVTASAVRLILNELNPPAGA
ncbi:MAG TPA: pyroglutamyl-peptidase I [Pirellulales bacterium]|nr:pyroglutamyl-peptidase I [Pirellulales bacterium]